MTKGQPRVELAATDAAFAYYSRLSRLKRHLESHLSDPLSATQAAGIVGLERRYFSTFFRQKVGVPFHVWRDSIRVGEATRLLGARNYPVSQVAQLVGFSDLRTFERAFKRHLGVTPRDFKRSARP